MKRYNILILLSLVWSSAFLFTKYLDSYVSPLMVLAARSIVGAAFLLLMCLILGESLRVRFSAREHALLCLSGVLVGYLWFSIAQSEMQLPAGMASLMPSSTALFSWFLCVVFGMKRFCWVHALGIILAAFGVISAIGWQQLSHHSASLGAVILLLSGFFSLALNAIMINRFFTHQSVLVVTTYSVSYAAIMVSLILLLHGHVSVSSLPSSVWVCLVGVGVISTSVGYMLYFGLIKLAGPVFTSLYGYLVPVFGVALSAFLFHEALTLHFFIGGLVILIGVFMVGYTRGARQTSE